MSWWLVNHDSYWDLYWFIMIHWLRLIEVMSHDASSTWQSSRWLPRRRGFSSGLAIGCPELVPRDCRFAVWYSTYFSKKVLCQLRCQLQLRFLKPTLKCPPSMGQRGRGYRHPRCDVDYGKVVSITKEAMQRHLDVVSLQVLCVLHRFHRENTRLSSVIIW